MALAAGVYESQGGFRPGEVQLIHGRIVDTDELWTGETPFPQGGQTCNIQPGEKVNLEVGDAEPMYGSENVLHRVVGRIINRQQCLSCILNSQCHIGTPNPDSV